MSQRVSNGLSSVGGLRPVPWKDCDLVGFDEPTRVAFAGCWHAGHLDARAAMRAAAEAGATVVVHTGDFLYTGVAAERLVHAVEMEARHLGLTVVVVRGNHDDPSIYQDAVNASRVRPAADGFARLSPRVLHAPNGFRWSWRGVQFTALGGAHSVDQAARREGVSWWAAEVATPADVDAVKAGGATNVLITHDIPDRVYLPFPPSPPDWWDIRGARQHRVRLAQAVDAVEPDWVIGGHMHFRYTGSMVTSGGKTVRVEVLDKVESGVHGNLFITELSEGVLSPSSGFLDGTY